MAKRKHNWMWRRLAANETRRPARQVEYKGNPALRGVRQHIPHPTTPALERFHALAELTEIDGVNHLIWRGGDTFRVDDETVTTPARFYYETTTGEKLGSNDILRRGCKIPYCVKHKRRQTQ